MSAVSSDLQTGAVRYRSVWFYIHVCKRFYSLFFSKNELEPGFTEKGGIEKTFAFKDGGGGNLCTLNEHANGSFSKNHSNERF